jgi:hypothetical protein
MQIVDNERQHGHQPDALNAHIVAEQRAEIRVSGEQPFVEQRSRNLWHDRQLGEGHADEFLLCGIHRSTPLSRRSNTPPACSIASVRRRAQVGEGRAELARECTIECRHAVEPPPESDVDNRAAGARRPGDCVAAPDQPLAQHVSRETAPGRLEQPMQLARRDADRGESITCCS